MAGRIQGADIKTVAELTAAGATSASLPQDTQIYVTASGLNKTLQAAIEAGDIGGGGSGGINLLAYDSAYSANDNDSVSFKSTVGNWVAYADTGATPTDMTGGAPNSAFTRNTTAPMNGTGNGRFTLTTGASRQGEGFSHLTYVPPAYRGRTHTFTFPYAVTGTLVEGDLTIFAYDVTNSELITPFTSSKILGASGVAVASIPLKTTTAQVRVGVHVSRTSTAALTLDLDDVSFGPVSAPVGMAGSDWASDLTFTPNNFGTPTGVDFKYRRVGDTIEVVATFDAVSAVASTASITLPKAINNLKIPNAAIGAILGQFSSATTGASQGIYVSGATGYIFYDGSDTSKVYFSVATASSALVKGTASGLDNGGPFTLRFSYPVVDWSSNVSMGESSTFSISSYLANGTRVTGTAPTAYGQYRSYLRNSNALTYTETNGAPGTAPSAANGIILYQSNGSFATADSSNRPSRYDLFIGKNKNFRVEFYPTSGKTGQLSTDYSYIGTQDAGVTKMYDPTTGVLTILHARTGTSNTAYLGTDANGSIYSGDAFYDVIVSENALQVGVQAPRSMVRLHTSNGLGSTNTAIRRYLTAVDNIGSGIVYADSASLGASFTIAEDGIFAISVYQRDTNASGHVSVGVSLNSTQLTTTVFSINTADRLVESGYSGAGDNMRAAASWTGFLRAGDVIRSHQTPGLDPDSAAEAGFTITKVSN